MPIDPIRLKELRKRKRLSRAQLAEQSRISQRQIARLESGAATESKARDRTVNELARALGVEPGVLTGEKPMPAASASPHREDGVSRQVSAQLQPAASLAYALIKRRYGIGLTTLFNVAPLMFVLLAEGSFVWRRERLKEAKEAANRLWSLGPAYRTFQLAAGYTEDGASVEQRSIERRDLFGEIVRDHTRETHDLDGVDDSNPFAEYLRDFAAKINDPEIVRIWDFIHDRGPLKSFPEFEICEGDVDRFANGSKKLNKVFRWGLLRIDHMPEELLADDAIDRRQKWLEERLEKWLEDLPKEQKEFWEDLLSRDLASSDGDRRGADT